MLNNGARVTKLGGALVAISIGALAAAGCASRPGSEVLTPVAQVPSYTSKAHILVATTRERGSATDPDAFTAERAKQLNYAALTVSIPPSHKPGQIEWPNSVPDPSLNFVTTNRQFLDSTAFLDQIRARARQGGPEANSVLIFVHGYNTLYEEAVYRFVQIVHDSGYQGTAILFAWPSRGKAPLYLADRDASTYSRDYLEKVLLDISGLPEVAEVNVLAHSMGNWLTVETLRQAKMNRHGDFNGKLADVVLASPDIDLNVFRTQLDIIGALPPPITLIVSGDDKALALSTKLAGGVERAGMLTAADSRVVAGAAQYNIRIVDLTGVQDGDGNHHSKFAESGAVIKAIGHGLAVDGSSGNAQPGVVTAIANIGDSLISAPGAILGVPQQK